MLTDPPQWYLQDEASFAAVTVVLPPNSTIHCESDAIVSMGGATLDVKGFLSGGILVSAFRFIFGQESFFTTSIENKQTEQADCLLAPKFPGGVKLHQLDDTPGTNLILVKGAYLASDKGVEVSTYVQRNLGNSLMSGTGFLMLQAKGRGTLAISSFGAIHEYVLGPGEERIVDNSHLLGWSQSVTYRTGMLKQGFLAGLTSGEGLVCTFTGPGTVYVQSHQPDVNPQNTRRGTRYPGGSVSYPVTPSCCYGVVVGTVALVVFLAQIMGVLGAFLEVANNSSKFDRTEL